jgi:hypothetical protein
MRSSISFEKLPKVMLARCWRSSWTAICRPLGVCQPVVRALADDDDPVAAAAARGLDDEVLALAELVQQRVDLEEAAADGDRRRDRDADRLQELLADDLVVGERIVPALVVGVDQLDVAAVHAEQRGQALARLLPASQPALARSGRHQSIHARAPSPRHSRRKRHSSISRTPTQRPR